MRNRECNTTLDPSDVRRPSSLGPSTQRARVCLYVTLINNTVDVVSFSELCTVYFTHGRHGGVGLQIRDGDGYPGQKRHTSQARFSYAAEPRAFFCYARVKIPPFLPIIEPRLRSLALRLKQFNQSINQVYYFSSTLQARFHS